MSPNCHSLGCHWSASKGRKQPKLNVQTTRRFAAPHLQEGGSRTFAALPIRSVQTMKADVQSCPKSKLLIRRGFNEIARSEGRFHLLFRHVQMAGTGHHLIMWILSVEFKYATENTAKTFARICIKVKFLRAKVAM